MALYDTRYGLPQSMVDYLNQGLPSIYQPPTVDPIDSQPIEDEEDQVLETIDCWQLVTSKQLVFFFFCLLFLLYLY